MASLFETAEQQIAASRYRDSLKTLWQIEKQTRENSAATIELIDLASAVQSQTKGQTRRECAVLLVRANATLERLNGPRPVTRQENPRAVQVLGSVTTPQQQERAIKAMWEGIPRTINRRNAEKHVPRLMESLADDEMPRHLATARNGSRQALLEGNRGGDIGVLTVTSRRLLWLGAKPTVIEIRASDVIHASGSRGGPLSSELDIALRDTTVSFIDVQPKEEAGAIAETLKSRTGEEFTIFAGSQAAISMRSDSLGSVVKLDEGVGVSV